MRGREKCRMLKQIRKQIADANEIPYVVEECPHQGECKGTCPKCEEELRQMEEALSLRRKLGKGIAIAGIATGIMASTTACSMEELIDYAERFTKRPGTEVSEIEGDIVMPTLEGEVPYKEDIPDDLLGAPKLQTEANETLFEGLE